MKKILLFFLCNSFLCIGLLGCSTQDVFSNIKQSGFEVVYDTSMLNQDVQDWIETKKNDTGIYKNKFSSGSFLLISMGNHGGYAVKKIDVIKDNYGFLFNITVEKSQFPNKSDQKNIPYILVKTKNIHANYDMKLIYR